MTNPDPLRSQAFRIQVAFGGASNEERRAEIQKLYPDKTDEQIKRMQKEFDRAETAACGFIEGGKKLFSDKEIDQKLTAAHPWMTQDAKDLVVWRAGYYDWHG